MRVSEEGGGHGNMLTIFDRACRCVVGSEKVRMFKEKGVGWNGMGWEGRSMSTSFAVWVPDRGDMQT
jgi:hypothetical protein